MCLFSTVDTVQQCCSKVRVKLVDLVTNVAAADFARVRDDRSRKPRYLSRMRKR